ncbi:MAG: betaine-aldehyde dehydrogenase [Neomegalonema sp.]|nr:betaine-aldehyde dehydrogenase [Neomegalonema sp.]
MRAQPPGSHYIDGRYVAGEGPRRQSLYPAAAEPIAEIADATKAEIDLAIDAAERGFAIWRKTPPAERARVLRRAADILRRDNRALSELETLDTGKPLQETLVADAASGADCLEYFAAQAATLTGEHIGFSGDEGDFAYTRREPLGVCLGVGAWNYPIQIACWKAAPALACGNAMIFKPSETTPLSALKLAEALTEAGLPAGAFNVVQGDGAVGAALVKDPRIAKVSLTGESRTGSKVMAGAAEGVKPVTLELGGKSPLIIFDDASLDDAVGAAMLANFYSTGQICSNGTRVFVHERVKGAFIEKLLTRTAALKLGDPLDEATQIGPLISQAQFEKVLGYYEIGKTEAELLAGGGRAAVDGFPNGYWVEPTIFDAADSARVAQEEIFGPALTLLTFDDEEDVVARANATPYGLAAGMFTQDLTRAHRMAARLQAGALWINAYNLTPIETPFGGVKRSGLGRENGSAAIEHYSQLKSVYVALGGVDAPY